MLRLIFVSFLTLSMLVACGPAGNKSGSRVRPRWAPASVAGENKTQARDTQKETQDAVGESGTGILPEAVSVFMGNVETKELKFDEKVSGIKVLVLPNAEEGAVKQESLSVTVHCASTLENAIERDLGTVVLSAGSQVVIARETNEKNTKKYLLLQCEGTNSAEARAHSADNIDSVKLAIGKTQLEAVLEDDEAEESAQDSDKTPSLSCKKEALDIAEDSLNGIYLLGDSDVLIHRNMESALVKGKSQRSRVVYSCR